MPSYDACDRPYPVTIVKELFDSYEEGKAVAQEKNEEYLHLLRKECINWEEKLSQVKQGWEQNIKIGNLFEQLVLKETLDMEITKMPEIEQDYQRKISKNK